MQKLLLALAAISLLLAGCTYQPSAPPLQLPPEANQSSPPGNVSPPPAQNQTAPPPQQQNGTYTCALEIAPETIYAGDATDISYRVYSKKSIEFTFNCGDEIRTISVGGLVSGSRLCNFAQPGKTTVYIKAAGETCAQKGLTVLAREQKPKTCAIDNTSIVRRLDDHYYSATIRYTGFNESDEIVWNCGNTVARSKVGMDAFSGAPSTMKEIYMDFSSSPRCDEIDVSIEGVPCGKIPTR